MGAIWIRLGVNFAICSAHAPRAELCLFDSADAALPSACVQLPEQTDMVWHGCCSSSGAGCGVSFRLPPVSGGGRSFRIIDTIESRPLETHFDGEACCTLHGRTLALFVLTSDRRGRQVEDAARSR